MTTGCAHHDAVRWISASHDWDAWQSTAGAGELKPNHWASARSCPGALPCPLGSDSGITYTIVSSHIDTSINASVQDSNIDISFSLSSSSLLCPKKCVFHGKRLKCQLPTWGASAQGRTFQFYQLAQRGLFQIIFDNILSCISTSDRKWSPHWVIPFLWKWKCFSPPENQVHVKQESGWITGAWTWLRGEKEAFGFSEYTNKGTVKFSLDVKTGIATSFTELKCNVTSSVLIKYFVLSKSKLFRINVLWKGSKCPLFHFWNKTTSGKPGLSWRTEILQCT